MAEETKKKKYETPRVESIQVQEPSAQACDVYNASDSEAQWTGSNVTGRPTYHC